MRACILFLVITFPVVCLAQTTASSPVHPVAAKPTATPFPDVTTLSGRTLKNARPFHVEPDGVTYMFAGGMVKVPFTDLPEAVRKQYGYDPKTAATFAREDAAAQEAAYQATQNATPSNPQAAQEVLRKAAEDADLFNSPIVQLHGTVVQVVDDGILIEDRGKLSLLEDYPKPGTVVDDDRSQGAAVLAGSYEYETKHHDRNRIPRYRYRSGTFLNR